MPITLRRTYRSNAGPSVGFGPGWNFDYGIYLYSESEAAGQGFLNVDVVMPDGARVFCNLISGTGYTNSTFQCTATPDSVWFGATITYDLALPGFDLVRKDRTVYKFGYNAPLQSVTDRNGNSITLVRSGGQTGNITQILGSNGRYINFTYTNGLITQATDALTLQYGVSRTISYGYDGSGRLVTITDRNYKTTTIGYSTVSGQIDNITSIKDANLNATTIGYTTTGGSGQPPIGSPLFDWTA